MLELPISKKADRAAVGRPEREHSAFRIAQSLRIFGIESTQPELVSVLRPTNERQEMPVRRNDRWTGSITQKLKCGSLGWWNKRDQSISRFPSYSKLGDGCNRQHNTERSCKAPSPGG